MDAIKKEGEPSTSSWPNDGSRDQSILFSKYSRDSCVIKTEETDKNGGNFVDASSTTSSSSKRSIILSELEDELERQLEEKAKRNELSSQNVKSLLRAVLIHEDVRKYVEFALKKSDEQPDYQLKLTRAKAKELIDKIPIIAPLLCLPIVQKKSDIDALINQELSEDSSDEEYKPLDETFDDEESVYTNGDDTPILSPLSISSVDCRSSPSLENIGQRTRSKLSLSKTPLETIEQAFIPPDITEDMYNTECDNQDWLNFLKELVQPLDTSADNVETNDDDNDPEYNIMVDEELEDLDNEELRVDRAVKISKKEVENLMSELFEYMEMHEDGIYSEEEVCSAENEGNVENLITEQEIKQSFPEVSLTPPIQNEGVNNFSIFLQTSSTDDNAGQIVTEEQYFLIQQQLMQHTQLLLQSYLLSCGNPFVDAISRDSCKTNLIHIKSLRDASPIANTVCAIPTLDSSLDLAYEYEAYAKSNAQKLYSWNQNAASRGTNKKTRFAGSTYIHPDLMRYCLKSPAFQYPLLLPKNGFKKSIHPMRLSFSNAEDILIALGLEDCVRNLDMDLSSGEGLLKACDCIRSALLPSKTAESIFKHINRKKQAEVPNPIQDFFIYKVAPGVEHFVVAVDSSNALRPLYLQDSRLIDTKWHKELYTEREHQKNLVSRKRKKGAIPHPSAIQDPAPTIVHSQLTQNSAQSTP